MRGVRVGTEAPAQCKDSEPCHVTRFAVKGECPDLPARGSASSRYAFFLFHHLFYRWLIAERIQ
jgi:hypothetical protein